MRYESKAGQAPAFLSNSSASSSASSFAGLFASPFDVHFGGPDLPPGHLRNLLLQRINDVPSAGEIDWVTYYFRDRELARALVDARRRGVKVKVTLAGKPRRARANEEVIKLLSGDEGLAEGLTVITLPGLPAPRGRSWRPQVHEKLYCFSHPEPVAYVGSFNPSGDHPEQHPEVIHEVGDHNTGHNLLIGIKQTGLFEKLLNHARHMQQYPPGLFHRFGQRAEPGIQEKDTSLYFWPRTTSHPVLDFLHQFGRGARVKIAASHIRSGKAIKSLCNLAKRGAEVQVIAESTHRRVTRGAENTLLKAGIRFTRLKHDQYIHVPMHLKFVLLESGNEQWSIFGSFNWTNPSFYLNHEIAAISREPALFQALEARWRILEEATQQT